MTSKRIFDPSRYLIKVNGAEYLEVKWRIAWLRAEHPDAIVETQAVDVSDDRAVFRASVSLPAGGSATGWGSESFEDFADFVEKAETKALGRALAALGYGTQFCPDFESVSGEVVDAPVTMPVYRRSSRAAETERPAAISSVTQAMTDRQRKFLFAVAREKGLDNESVEQEARIRFQGAQISDLDRRQASRLIDAIQALPALAFTSEDRIPA